MAFGDSITLRIAQLEQSTLQRKRTWARQYLFALQEETPVLTGRAQAGWRVTRNRPTRAQATVTNLSGVNARNLATVAAIRNEDAVFIGNNVPYITLLEDERTSAKAPDGIIGPATLKARARMPRTFRAFTAVRR